MPPLFSKKERGQGLVEFALIFGLVAIVGISGEMLLGPSVATRFNSISTTMPPLAMGGLEIVINPTDPPTNTASPTGIIPPTFTATVTSLPTSTVGPTHTVAPTWTTAPTQTLAPTATSIPTNTPFVVPTITFAPTFTNTPAPTQQPSITPTLTYEQWCISMGYNWRPLTQKCKWGGVVVTPPP